MEIPGDEATRALTEPNRDTRFRWFPLIDGQMFFPDNPTFWDSFKQVYHKIKYVDQSGKVAVFAKPDGIRAKHAIAMEHKGIRTVAEVDDTLLSDPHQNIFMRMNKWNKLERRKHLVAMASFMVNVFSTDLLRDMYYKAMKKELKRDMDEFGVKMPDMYVCQNNVDLDDWPERIERDGPLRVGWMGSAQHYRDVKLGYGALHLARSAGCDIYMVGANFADTTGVTHPKALEACFKWAALMPKQIPWVDPEVYHRTALPFDIGIIPLELTEHTKGKSDVKALEYTISGAAVLAQNHPIYSKHWIHNETCLLANSPEEFGRMMWELVRSESLRTRLVTAAQQYVRENRTMQVQGREEWQTALHG